MARIKGLFSVSSNYEPTIAAPLDAREVVQYKSDLITRKTWLKNNSLFLYNGLRVSVTEDTEQNNGVYVLLNKDLYMEYSSWQQLATMSEIDELREKIKNVEVGDSFEIVDAASDLPIPGKQGRIYFCRAEGISKSWDAANNNYITVGSDFNTITVINGGTSTRN